jgi:hypothetical protein
MKTINVLAGSSSAGEPVYEELPVTEVGSSIFRLLSSPGLALGIAKDDEIRFYSDTGRYELVKRGRRLAIQLFVAPPMAKNVEVLASQLAMELGGTLDGHSERQAVFSIPVEKGFAKIESVFNRFVEDNPGAEWYFGNVYAEDGVTPLNWWQKS